MLQPSSMFTRNTHSMYGPSFMKRLPVRSCNRHISNDMDLAITQAANLAVVALKPLKCHRQRPNFKGSLTAFCVPHSKTFPLHSFAFQACFAWSSFLLHNKAISMLLTSQFKIVLPVKSPVLTKAVGVSLGISLWDSHPKRCEILNRGDASDILTSLPYII